jgi:hypothetical protein
MKSSADQQDKSGAQEPKLSRKALLWRRVRLFRTALLVMVLVGLGVTWLSGIMDSRLDEYFTSRWPTYGKLAVWPEDGRPFFADIVRPEKEKIWGTLPPSVPLKIRLSVAYDNLRYRLNPAGSPAPTWQAQQCGLRFLLRQCANINGKRYLVSIEALSLDAQTVYFGNTNALNGAQLVAAVEKAISDNGWLLIPENRRLVKVIPKDKLEKYRKAGLVKLRN